MTKELKTDFNIVINNIFKSGLPYSSRKLIYCKMVMESIKCGYCDLEKLKGVDIAYDDVYNRMISENFNDDENVGC